MTVFSLLPKTVVYPASAIMSGSAPVRKESRLPGSAPYEVSVPGAFETFFSGTGVVAGNRYSDNPEEERGAAELRAAWNARTVTLRGRGCSLGLVLPSIEAAVVLAEYAATCLHANHGGDPEYSEIGAARKVLERVADATGHRVAYNGFSVTVDGRRVF